MSQGAKQILEKYRKIVWPEIKKYLKDPVFPDQFKIPSVYRSEIENYWKIVCEYPERKGKYLRPTLVCLITEAMGTKLSRSLKTAAAMQLSEEWLLIHDDIQDNSKERRGKSTLHRLFGTELALNAGDSLHTIMWRVLLDNQKTLGPEKSIKIMEEFCLALFRTEHGQAVEIMRDQNKTKMKDKDWFFIADGKTSYYTIALPVRLGAIIAGANNEQLRYLTDFGLNLGRSFQLIDDIMDIDQDRQEKRLTIPLAKGISYSRNLAKNYHSKAKHILENELKFLKNEPARSNLETIVDFILERTH